jgi:TonB family protein
MSSNNAFRALAMFAILFVASSLTPAQSNPAQSSSDLSRGIELYHQSKYVEASALLKTVVKRNKTDEQAWYYLGLVLIRQKELKDATKALETALKLRPNSASSHTALGYALLLRNKVPLALQESLAALAIVAGLVDAHYISGVAYLRLGKRELALKEAESALKLDSRFANAYLLKSQALVSFAGDVLIQEIANQPVKERYSQAGDALEKYLQLTPNNSDKETWADQLDSLRFFGPPRNGPDKIAYSGNEVTVKARVLSKSEPAYTDLARGNGVTGTVVLRAIFAADGKVKHLMVIKALPDGLTEKAILAARGIKFVPAQVDGRSVSTYIQLEYNFNLH